MDIVAAIKLVKLGRHKVRPIGTTGWYGISPVRFSLEEVLADWEAKPLTREVNLIEAVEFMHRAGLKTLSTIQIDALGNVRIHRQGLWQYPHVDDLQAKYEIPATNSNVVALPPTPDGKYRDWAHFVAQRENLMLTMIIDCVPATGEVGYAELCAKHGIDYKVKERLKAAVLDAERIQFPCPISLRQVAEGGSLKWYVRRTL